MYRVASLADEEAIKTTLRDNEMASWVSLSTEHEPSYFASADLFGHRKTIVAVKENSSTSAGMGSYALMPVHVNGNVVTGGYLGQLRVRPEFRNRFRAIRNAYQALKVISQSQGDTPIWFTSIASQNLAAKRLLEANLKHMPAYQPVGEMITMALSATGGTGRNVMRAAERADIPALTAFYNQSARRYQYSPALSEAWLGSLDGRHGLSLDDFWVLKDRGTIRACFALWDQRKLKQSVVRGYRFPLALLRRPYNALARLTRRVTLPPVGEPISYLFVAFLGFEGNAQSDRRIVIDSARALVKARNAPIAMLGVSAQSDMVDELRSVPKVTYHTTIESVTWPEDAAVPLDGRMVQPEIAIL